MKEFDFFNECKFVDNYRIDLMNDFLIHIYFLILVPQTPWLHTFSTLIFVNE